MSELLMLIGDTFGWRSNLLDDFKELLLEKGIQESQVSSSPSPFICRSFRHP